MAATTQQIPATQPTPAESGERRITTVTPESITLYTEATMVPNDMELTGAAPFGQAVEDAGGDRIRIRPHRILQIYQLTSSPEQRQRDRGTCGRLTSDFTPNQDDYEDDRYE
jgi:hypothetical protein